MGESNVILTDVESPSRLIWKMGISEDIYFCMSESATSFSTPRMAPTAADRGPGSCALTSIPQSLVSCSSALVASEFRLSTAMRLSFLFGRTIRMHSGQWSSKASEALFVYNFIKDCSGLVGEKITVRPTGCSGVCMVDFKMTLSLEWRRFLFAIKMNPTWPSVVRDPYPWW